MDSAARCIGSSCAATYLGDSIGAGSVPLGRLLASTLSALIHLFGGGILEAAIESYGSEALGLEGSLGSDTLELEDGRATLMGSASRVRMASQTMRPSSSTRFL
jgi:hypothetical protein